MLEHVHQSLEKCRLQHEKMINDMACSKKDIEQYYQKMLSLFTHETSGRSIENGLSDKQISLAKSFEALHECVIELEKHLKRMKLLKIDTFERCLETLDEMQKAHPNG